MSSLQLVCINYGSIVDAACVVHHCIRSMPLNFFSHATILHPEGADAHGIISDIKTAWIPNFHVHFIKAISPTQNECCMYEMPQYITCDHALGIQWDGFIVNPDSWTDEFLEYDYIAPPWPLTNIVNADWRVGSGGFCLFSKRMAQLWGKLDDPHPAPNDWQTGAIKRASFEKRGMKYAPLELAMRFGEEIPLDDQPRVEKPFGFHAFQYGDHEKYRKLVYDN